MRRTVATVLTLSTLALLPVGGCTVNRMTHLNRSARTDVDWVQLGGVAPVQVVPLPSDSRPPVAEPGLRPLPEGERLVLAVMEIEDTSGSMNRDYLGNAQEMLRGKLAATGHFVVIDKSRQEEKLRQLVHEQKKESYKACYDQKCQVPLGQALAADSILRTTISCLGTACMLSCELVDLEKEAAVSGGTADFENSAAELKKAVDSVVAQLLARLRR